jgi:Icc-related predicted phosphoesterase
MEKQREAYQEETFGGLSQTTYPIFVQVRRLEYIYVRSPGRLGRMLKSLKITCISDTHTLHRELELPGGDLLVHGGDFTMFGSNAAAIRDFNDWLGEQDYLHKIVIPGNHEGFLESDPSKRKWISNARLLINESIEVMGLKIWGSPVTPLYGGAFGLSSETDRRRLYAKIPEDVDILVTHGPPFGILDKAPGSDNHAGCRELLQAVLRVKPRLHICGHIHGAHGTYNSGETLFVNAALLGQDGDLSDPPVSIQISRM